MRLQDFIGRNIDLEHYRRNIFVTGQDPLEFIGQKFRIGEIEFEGIENCSPCQFMENLIGKGVLNWMRENNSGGLRAKILSSGQLSVGDQLR